MDLNQRTAIVTGATGGIGNCIALALAKKGVRLALVGRKFEQLQALVEEIHALGGEADQYSCDIRSREEVEAAVAAAHRQFGSVDILVNCAFWGPPASLQDTTEAFWDQTLDTTLKAPYLFVRAAAPIMKAQGGGRIVNIGSLAGKVGEDNRTAYCAAKWGLEGLSAALSVELLKDNIHVHLISPAATHTPWWHEVGAAMSEAIIARMVPPQVIGEAVIWVLSQPDQVHIPDVPIYNFRNPFEGKSSPFEGQP